MVHDWPVLIEILIVLTAALVVRYQVGDEVSQAAVIPPGERSVTIAAGELKLIEGPTVYFVAGGGV